MWKEDNYEHVSPGLIYIDTSFPGTGIDPELYSSRPEGCSCYPICEESTCDCFKRSGAPISSDIATRVTQHYPIFQCNSDCKCGPQCANRLTQKGPLRGLKVVPIAGKGFGVVTEEDVQEGSFVCEYAGEAIGEEEARRRFAFRSPAEANYILVLREHIAHCTYRAQTQITIVDPTIVGNIGRYLNHSCDPNLCVVPIRSESFVPIAAMFSTRLIKSGEELCYNYDSATIAHDNKDKPSQNVYSSSKPCQCLSSKCRGFLPANPILS